MLALSAATRMRPWELLETSIAEAAANPQNIIVTVYLGGGNDGLNTLLPLTGQDRTIYDAARPRLGIAPGSALAVPGHADLGWHPQLASLKTLFDESKVGAYLGVDYPNPDYSHFQSVYYWRTGQLKNGATTGWLGNWLDAYGSATNPLQGVAVQWAADDLLRTRRAPTAAVYSPSDFSYYSDGIWDQDRLVSAYGGTAGPARSAARRRAMDVVRQSVYVNHALKPLAGKDPPPTPLAVPGHRHGRVAAQRRADARRGPRHPRRDGAGRRATSTATRTSSARTAGTSPTSATRCSRSSATWRRAASPTGC